MGPRHRGGPSCYGLRLTRCCQSPLVRFRFGHRGQFPPNITHQMRSTAMPRVPKRITDDAIKVRELSNYQFTWVAGESQENGTFTLQLVLDEGAWEEVVAVTAEDAEVLQGLLKRSESVYYDIPRRTLMFGTRAPGS